LAKKLRVDRRDDAIKIIGLDLSRASTVGVTAIFLKLSRDRPEENEDRRGRVRERERERERERGSGRAPIHNDVRLATRKRRDINYASASPATSLGNPLDHFSLSLSLSLSLSIYLSIYLSISLSLAQALASSQRARICAYMCAPFPLGAAFYPPSSVRSSHPSWYY
jgi:hypothetical protein